MLKMREYEQVDASYVTAAPTRNTLRQPINVPASTLFNCLADGPAWNEWLGITVEWTTPEPRGVGTTRTVTTNGQRIDEYFFVWDEGERMAFRFDRSTLPLSAFVEHYECVAVSDSSCALEWSYGYDWGGPLAPMMAPAFGAFFGFNAKRGLKKLAALLESDPTRFA